jgi:hypothetical protein
MLTWWRFKDSLSLEVVDFEDRKKAEDKFYEEATIWMGDYDDCQVQEFEGELFLLDEEGVEIMTMTKEYRV